MKATKHLVLNSDIQGSFKKFSLLFGQAEMIFVVVWFLDHFIFKSIPSMNGIWIIAFVGHRHVWVTKFKPSFMFFQLPVLTLNNVVLMPFLTVLFDEAQQLNILRAAGIIRNTQQRRHLYYNFKPRRGHRWSVGKRQPIMGALAPYQPSILSFCSKLSQQYDLIMM